MPSLIDIRRRIRSVRNTQQITKAMKMVSAAKLRRAQDRVVAARPYAALLRELLGNVAAAIPAEQRASVHRLLAHRPEQRIQVLLMTSDKGLAGAFNANLIKAAQRFLHEHSESSISMELVGRKGRDFFRKTDAVITGENIGLLAKVQYADAQEIARKVIDGFAEEEIDAAYLIHAEFKTAVSQQFTVKRVLPVELPESGEPVEYIFEQPPVQMMAELLPRYVETEIYRALLESVAAEHAARMTAMEAASSNAADMIESLTLHMNRVRQASITKEIIEVVSGASVE